MRRNMEKKDIEKLEGILKKYSVTPDDVDIYLKGLRNNPRRGEVAYVTRLKNKDKFGVISDLHIGNKEFDEGLLVYASQLFTKEKVKKVFNVGDTLDGMSGREGQVYELTYIGFDNQIEYAAKIFNKYLSKFEIYGIDGNHDGWYKKKGDIGVIVGRELEKRVSNYHHLGEMEADVDLGEGVIMKLFHPNDGTAYATSYKLQKLMESFEGGKKPNILLEGHYHKALYMFNRNIHGLECGTMCGQTQWMRGKKIPAHKGFWIIGIEFSKGGIGRFAPEFFPAYD
jgi:predicted phosphodiesterase